MGLKLEYKAASAKGAAGGVLATEEDDDHTFSIIASVTGVVDEVGDIIEPGAYAKTLAARFPKIIKDHDWSKRLGKTLAIEELHPGDPRLPKVTNTGKPWPTAAGALVAKVKLFAGTVRGDEAARRWAEEGDQAQFSIGYAVPESKARRGKDGIRHIKELVCFEVSDVLWGAMPLSGVMPEAMATKALDAMLADGTITEDAATGDADDVAQVLAADTDMDGEPVDLDEPAEQAEDEVAPVLSDADWAAIDALGDEILPDPDEGAIAGAEGYDDLVGRRVTRDERLTGAKQGYARPDGSWLIGTRTELARALARAVTTDADPGVKAHVAARAIDLGIDAAIPAGWVPGLKYDTSPVGDPGGRQNWVDKAGGLPAFVRAVAHALIRNGHPKASAIAIAVGTIRRWASGGGKVNEKTRAKAAAALAEWEAKKGKAKATKSLPEETRLSGWNPTAETGPWAAGTPTATPLETKGLGRLPGTLECHIQGVREAVERVLRGTPRDTSDGSVRYQWQWVNIDGTWPDRVVATRTNYDTDDSESYQIAYQTGPDGQVLLGEPQPVTLTLTVQSGDDEATDGSLDLDGALADMLDEATYVAAKTLPGVEVKAGRVLSGRNGERLTQALRGLLDVLKAAGIEIGELAKPDTTPQAAASGAPSGPQAAGVKVFDPAEALALAAALRADAAR